MGIANDFDFEESPASAGARLIKVEAGESGWKLYAVPLRLRSGEAVPFPMWRVVLVTLRHGTWVAQYPFQVLSLSAVARLAGSRRKQIRQLSELGGFDIGTPAARAVVAGRSPWVPFRPEAS